MTEVAFCERLRAWAEGLGFVVYPEVNGWDLVLVAGPTGVRIGRFDVGDGEQVGVHAKLRANCDVIAQAMEPGYLRSPQPTYAVVAVPRAGQSFRIVASRLGIGVVVTEMRRPYEPDQPKLVEQPRRRGSVRLPLPSIASRAIRAGSPSPRVLSPWRESALRFLAFARANDGRITTADLKRHGISRNWVRHWLVDTGERSLVEGMRNKSWVYRLVDNPQALPDYGYEDVYQELVASL